MKIVADQNIPFVADCFSSVGQVTTLAGRDIDTEAINDADALLVRSITNVNEELLDGSSVKFVGTATIGTDHIDQNYLKTSGIGFASAPGSNANSVAEYVVAALLAVAKKHKFTLEGKSIGIVGVGNVGSRVEAKCRALGMIPVLNDPPLKRKTSDDKYRPLSELYDCDFITLHTPLTHEGEDKTFHLVDQNILANLKQGIYLLNTSRGPVADNAAVKDALNKGHLAGAILDVWEGEPVVDPELLLKAEISTPHIAGYSYDGKVGGMLMIYNALCSHFDLQPRHTAHDFLPEPQVPDITVDANPDDEQKIIHDTVQQIYVINRDDFNMREILLITDSERGPFFDKLRKEYPIRREFQNTVATLRGTNDSLASKLKGIGFQVRKVQ
ncbi:Erythronate-4-phosphate dehydrogenase [Anaerohalosphaera lusitana]|uniref:Erythronate-4-phosphate dehydrogenase n=1 Tax=Anaerohalosphaera lusitana TaxID=1936003 RepID=A0A1U9NMJ3_9BACT|nr:4-phosphoerythronate dehydrogenase [Anaerohalosphaera lusitana]AQT69141.1 Erythronate-4-phosphate dehydrogenase [Anaerohalosphaera lusitana]